VLPKVDALVAAIDQKSQADSDKGTGGLLREHGLEELVPGFIAAYPKIKNWAGRNSVLFWLIRFARKRPEVVELALTGLRDSAYMVRMQACAILAYALRRDAIPPLEELLSHRNQETRADAAAAIDAIKHKNHHYWVDRDHSGKVRWEVNSGG
jgi:HEAT repeat protein